MQMQIPDYLINNPFPNAGPFPPSRPVAIVDGRYVNDPEAPGSAISGDLAYVVGINARSGPQTLRNIRVNKLRLYEIRCEDLSDLGECSQLTELSLDWSTKVTDLSFIGRLEHLEILVINDFPNAHDLAPLSQCTSLRMLHFSGGMWNKNTASSLAPLADLPNLEFLALWNLKVSESIRPLHKFKNLRYLEISSQFPTEDLAFLKAKMPNTECENFAPYVKMSTPIGDKDIMVIGSRKPLLNSKSDRIKIKKYEERFNKMVAKYR